jgi:hypothetical protein
LTELVVEENWNEKRMFRECGLLYVSKTKF